ncbi:hypothetical protein [Nitrolancea hollandica]|uniref:hypothetical protein n=1 Tax=Nitrolancea hollandica TaxID=1206749 RepID=UPI0002D62F4E|nr:hypothetical protein [Nitrolancea hollandica]
MTEEKLSADRAWLALVGLVLVWIVVMMSFDPASVKPGSTYAVPPTTGIINHAPAPPTNDK